MKGWKAMLVMLAIVASLVLVTAGTAVADPTNAKRADFLTLECDVLGEIDIVANGNGLWTPGHVVGSNVILIPYKFHFEFTFEGGTDVFDAEKKAPNTSQLDVCTFGGEEEEGSFSGTAWVSYRP